MAFQAKTFFSKTLKVLKWAVIGFFSLSILTTVIYRFVPPPITPLMIIRLGGQLFSGESLKLKKDWVSIDQISPNMELAVVAAEDQQFTEHWGFDFNAIQKAIKNNDRKKKKAVHGGSTISQQTAKNVFLWPGRSWVRKGFEVYFTLLIELCWSKERIIEVYMNEVEMGNGIYGVEAASQAYFHKHAKSLSQGEAALIAAILPSPLRWSPVKPSGYVMMRQRWIMRNMNNLGNLELE
jgi:monofunctional biosynthetic peptidoglycan transglycosylase